MGRRISVYLDDELVASLNAHTRTSPLGRSELIAVALRRFLDEEAGPRSLCFGLDSGETEVPRRIAVGDLPSHAVDGLESASSDAPHGN